MVTVISGTLHFGAGDKLDATKTKTIIGWKRSDHAAQDEPFGLDERRDDRQVHGVGPWGVITSIPQTTNEEMTATGASRRLRRYACVGRSRGNVSANYLVTG